MKLTVYRSLAELPEHFERCFAPAQADVTLSRPWLETFHGTDVPAGDRPRLFALEDGEPLALIPGLRSRLYASHIGARVLYFAQPDGIDFRPCAAPGAPPDEDIFRVLIRQLRNVPETYDVVRIGPLASDSRVFETVLDEFRRAGFLVQPYFGFPNWRETVKGRSADEYLRARGRNFRRSVRRRVRRLDERPGARFEMIAGTDAVDAGIEAYREVFARRRNRLQDEPMSAQYMEETIRCAAAAGALRLGVVFIDEKPVAFQFCLVSGGEAHFLRTGYDAMHRAAGVGKVVIYKVLSHVIDVDQVHTLDFGVGDHEYKSDWVGERREHWGVAAFNPRTRRGLQNAAIHLLGRRAKPALKRLRDFVLRRL